MARNLIRRLAQRSSNAESTNNPSKALERLELWSLVATLLIFVGIAASFVDVIAIRFPGESWRQVASEEIGNVLEGIGLVIEAIVIPWAIIHTRREKSESDKEVSEANKLAAEANERAVNALKQADVAKSEAAKANERTEALRNANLKLEKALQPRLLRQYPEAERLRQFSTIKARILYVNDFETSRLVRQMVFLFQQAGWANVTTELIPDWQDEVWIYSALPLDMSGFLPTEERKASEALRDIFLASGIGAAEYATKLNISPNEIRIHVGVKKFIEEKIDESSDPPGAKARTYFEDFLAHQFQKAEKENEEWIKNWFAEDPSRPRMSMRGCR